MKHSRDGVLPASLVNLHPCSAGSWWRNFSLYQDIIFPILIYDNYLIFLSHTSVRCLNLSSQKPAHRYRYAAAMSTYKATSPEEAQLHHPLSHGKCPSLVQPGGFLLHFLHLSMSFSHSGLQNWMQHSKRGRASAKQEQTTTSITTSSSRSWRGSLSCCQNTAGLSPACFPIGSPSPFHESCCPSSLSPPCPRYRKYVYAVYKIKGSNKQGFLHFKLWYITVLYILTRLSQGHRPQPFHPQQ